MLPLHVEGGHAGVNGTGTQMLFDAEQLVVLGHALGAAGSTGLDLAGVQGHGQIGNGGVLGLAGTVRADGGVTGLVCHLDGLQGLGDGTDLVQLDEDGVARTQLDALGKALGVGDEQVIAHKLDLAAQLKDSYFCANYAKGASADFESAYKAEYGEDYPNGFAPLGYDAATTVLYGIQAAEDAGLEAGSDEYKQAVIDAIAGGTIEGLTGTFTFDEHHDPVKSTAILTYIDGKPELKEMF